MARGAGATDDRTSVMRRLLFTREFGVGSVMSASADLWRLPLLARADLTRAERTTLDAGSTVMLGAAVAGMQLGGWPWWSGVGAIAGYVAWVLLYSETTIQVTRRRTARAARLPLAAEPATPPG